MTSNIDPSSGASNINPPPEQKQEQQQSSSWWGRSWGYGPLTGSLSYAADLGKSMGGYLLPGTSETKAVNENKTEIPAQVNQSQQEQKFEKLFSQIESVVGKGVLTPLLKETLKSTLKDPENYKKFNEFVSICEQCYVNSLELLRKNQEVTPENNPLMLPLMASFIELVPLTIDTMYKDLLVLFITRAGSDLNVQVFGDSLEGTLVDNSKWSTYNFSGTMHRYYSILEGHKVERSEKPWNDQVLIDHNFISSGLVWTQFGANPQKIKKSEDGLQTYQKATFTISRAISGSDVRSFNIQLDLSPLGELDHASLLEVLDFIKKFVAKTDTEKARQWIKDQKFIGKEGSGEEKEWKEVQAILKKYPALGDITLSFRSEFRNSLSKLNLSVGNPQVNFSVIQPQGLQYHLEAKALALNDLNKLLGSEWIMKPENLLIIPILMKALEDPEVLDLFNKAVRSCQLAYNRNSDAVETSFDQKNQETTKLVSNWYQKMASHAEEIGDKGMTCITKLQRELLQTSITKWIIEPMK